MCICMYIFRTVIAHFMDEHIFRLMNCFAAHLQSSNRLPIFGSFEMCVHKCKHMRHFSLNNFICFSFRVLLLTRRQRTNLQSCNVQCLCCIFVTFILFSCLFFTFLFVLLLVPPTPFTCLFSVECV